jgi:hypothetical protein
MELGLDTALTSFTLSPHGISIRVDELHAAHLAAESGSSSSSTTEAHIADFLEGWVSTFVAGRMEGMVLFPSLYHLWSLVLRVDEVHHEEGGLGLFFSVFHGDDPQVDGSPPDTTLSVLPGDEGEVVASFGGADDRGGELAYSWAMDGQAWSEWSTEASALISVVDGEQHSLQVRARDAWWNVDPTPAEMNFLWGEGELSPRGCGCASSRRWGGHLFWLGLAGLALLRRRP